MVANLIRIRVILSLCLALGTIAATANAQVDSVHDWTNNYGSGNYNWFTTTNWDPTTVPGSSDTTRINGYCDPSHYVTINTNGSTAYTSSLTLGTDNGNAGYLLVGSNAGSGGLGPNGHIYVGRNGTGVIVQSGGTVNNYAYGSSENLYLGYGNTGNGAYYLQGGTLWTHDEYIGRDNAVGGSAFFNQTGGQNHIGHSTNSDGKRDLFIGYCGNGITGKGTYRLDGTGQLFLENKDGCIYVGDHYGSNATEGRFEWFRSGGISFGSGGDAKMILDTTINTSTLAMGYDFNIANLQSGGLIPIEGLSNATLEITNGATGSVVSGNNVSQYYLRTGTIGLGGTGSQTGGSLSVNDEYVGYGGTGTFTQSGGTHADTWHLYVGVNAGGNVGTGTYNLNGGTLTVGTLAVGTDFGSGGGTGTIVQTGSSSSHSVNGNVFLGSTTSPGTYKISGGAWNVSGFVSGADNGSIVINGGTVGVAGSISVKNFTLGDTSGYNGTFTLAAGKSLTATNETIGQGGAGVFTQNGGANNCTNLTIGAGSTYTMSGGSLTAGQVLVGQGGSATFNIGSQNPSVSTLTLKNGTVSGAGTITATSGYQVESGTIGANLAGNVALTKSTSGTATLSGACSYGGNTGITSGTLLVDGLLTSSTASVTVGGATLGGTGVINRLLTTSSDSFVSPGDNGIGTLTLSAADTPVMFNGTLLIEASGAGTGYCDLLDVSQGNTGTLNVTNAAVSFDILRVLDDPAYIFLKYDSLSGPFRKVEKLPPNYEIDYDYMGNQVALVLVPEPSTLALLAAGVIGLSARVWRRRKRVT